jgi:hypothetical protein
MTLPISSTVPESVRLSPLHAEKTKKSVSFSSVVTCHEVEIISKKAGFDLWWTLVDFQGFRRRDKQTLKVMDNVNCIDVIPDNSMHCTRGLECKTQDGAFFRKFYRIQAWLAVLEEQSFQLQESKIVEEDIASLYTLFCQASVDEARTRALKDQFYVDKHIIRTTEDGIMSSTYAKKLSHSVDNRSVIRLDAKRSNEIQQFRIASTAA